MYVALVRLFTTDAAAQHAFRQTIACTAIAGVCAAVLFAPAVAPAVAARADSGFLYADVQQQVVSAAVVHWWLATAFVTAVAYRRESG